MSIYIYTYIYIYIHKYVCIYISNLHSEPRSQCRQRGVEHSVEWGGLPGTLFLPLLMYFVLGISLLLFAATPAKPGLFLNPQP